ncbi:TetR/AcrR family transcriptional regulator [Bacillus salitolerans]|uniref:TetR/AcrR family transcriptional regulator n=1 Tax=Bacillus salitolerans TaxID=1437434 RepID=A0ABW4LSL0_9BACI
MKDRKQHVVKKAHELFIEKGFHSTSIQDILDYSGISKGTFYNYFSSKNELLIELFQLFFTQIEKKRNELLLGHDPSNIEIFIQQVEYQMNAKREYKLIPLFEEVLISSDEELKTSIKKGQMKIIHWVYERFLDIFGEEKKPYLLDCAIMFLGLLHHNTRYYSKIDPSSSGIHKVVQYSMNRMLSIAMELEETNEQLFQPELLHHWLPESEQLQNDKQELNQKIVALKQFLLNSNDSGRYTELLDFIQEELLNSNKPRKYLVETTISSLYVGDGIFEKECLDELKAIVMRLMK